MASSCSQAVNHTFGSHTAKTHQNYKLFVDHWFRDVPLILTLSQQGTHCVGIVCNYRLPAVSFMCEAGLERTGHGSLEQKMAVVGDITLHAVKWYDTRLVSLLSD